MIIAVDFDGTLFENNYPEIGEPIWKVINYCIEAKDQGNTLILWTCREGRELDEAIEACNKVGLSFDYINENTSENIDKYQGIDNRKVFADIYIDDKALNPETTALIGENGEDFARAEQVQNMVDVMFNTALTTLGAGSSINEMFMDEEDRDQIKDHIYKALFVYAEALYDSGYRK